MRRGLIVLGAGPALVALVGGLPWDTVLILPGPGRERCARCSSASTPGASTAAGMLWRESLPVAPACTFDARTLVVRRVPALRVGHPGAGGLAVRNGLPTMQIAIALIVCWLVVVVQVLAISMSWSVRRPYAVDLRSPRATPAPHAAMFGYAMKLSLVTTLTGMLFVGAAGAARVVAAARPRGAVPALVGVRLFRARRRWLSAPARAEIALTVAAG